MLDLSWVQIRAVNASREMAAEQPEDWEERGERFDTTIASLADVALLAAELTEARREIAHLAEQLCDLEGQLHDTRDTIDYLREGN